jgi:hypothetical protein
LSRGGGARRGGPAAGGSLGENRGRRESRTYSSRGRAADGDLGTRHPRGEWEDNRQERLEAREERHDERDEERTERREDWQDHADERRENWQEYAEDHYDDDDGGYYGGYYEGYYYDDDYNENYASGEPYYYDLPCSPVVMSTHGTVYYVCHPDWYMRAYVDGDVVYVIVPDPRQH